MDAGRGAFDGAAGQDEHGDCVWAGAMAVVVADRRVGRQGRSIQLNPKGHERRPGRPRQGGAARQVIKQRLEESRARAERDMYRQIGQHDDPFFE